MSEPRREPEPTERDLTVARLRFGRTELRGGAGRAIPEPISVMLDALLGWRIGILEAEANEETLRVRPLRAVDHDDKVIDIDKDGRVIDVEGRELP